MREKALVARRDQGQHFMSTGHHAEVNSVHWVTRKKSSGFRVP